MGTLLTQSGRIKDGQFALIILFRFVTITFWIVERTIKEIMRRDLHMYLPVGWIINTCTSIDVDFGVY